jgi:SAM-dependent methyltransferase
MTTHYEAIAEAARFPRSSKYHPEWILSSVSSGSACALWLAEWLSEKMDLRADMRVLDLGCGRAASSIFLRREFGVQVWAVDLECSATENLRRAQDAGVADGVFPIRADARALPFAEEFFDAIVCLDAIFYFGTDDLYLNYLTHFVKADGQIGIAGAGLTREVEGPVPDHLRDFWTQDVWSIHSVDWWRKHWQRTGIVDVEIADAMCDGWKLWFQWHRAVAPDNTVEIAALESDRGELLNYIRMVGRRRTGVTLAEPCFPLTLGSRPVNYRRTPLLRADGQ